MATILVPDVNNHNFSYKSVDLWKELQWYNPLWNIPYTSEWNECMDQMWWSAFYKHMDPYLDILKQHTEDPLIETIVELEWQLEEATVGTVCGSPIPDFIRDAILAVGTKPVVAGLFKK